ncbi:MAG: hypothetical protein JXA71_17455 [Chitinispirillaceae bacterium]|nr:hypothetical protein [Chitinispirillaceae bacterium]
MRRIAGDFPNASSFNRLFSLSVVAASVLLAVFSGFRFSAGDIDTYLPFILHAHDPSLFANDLLLGTLGSHPVYIWKTLAFLLHWTGIGTMIRTVFILQTSLVAFGAFLFFRRFFGNGRGWIFFLLLLLIPVSAPGYGMYGLNPYGYFHAGTLAFGLALIAYTLIDRGWRISSGILTGAIFLIHPITAVYAAGFLFIRGIMDFGNSPCRLRIVAGWLLLVAIALPSLLPAFQKALGAAEAAIDPDFWRSLARLRMNHGYFISAWVPERFIQLAACFALVLLLWRKHPAWKRLLPIVIVVAGGLLAMTVADLFTIRFFLRLQLGRCSYFLFFLVTAFAADAVTNPGLWKRDHATLTAWTGAALALLVIYGNGALAHQSGWIRPMIVIILAAGAATIALRWFRPLHPGVLFAFFAAMIVTTSIPRSIENFRWTRSQELRDPWISFAAGCSKHIPRDRVVMIPLYRQDFRPYALRATYGTWKDGAPHLFCDKTLPEWWRRMQLFGVTLATNKRELPGLYHRHAISVARAEGIRYVVFDKTLATTSSPLLSENEAFGLIDLAKWGAHDSLPGR